MKEREARGKKNAWPSILLLLPSLVAAGYEADGRSVGRSVTRAAPGSELLLSGWSARWTRSSHKPRVRFLDRRGVFVGQQRGRSVDRLIDVSNSISGPRTTTTTHKGKLLAPLAHVHLFSFLFSLSPIRAGPFPLLYETTTPSPRPPPNYETAAAAEAETKGWCSASLTVMRRAGSSVKIRSRRSARCCTMMRSSDAALAFISTACSSRIGRLTCTRRVTGFSVGGGWRIGLCGCAMSGKRNQSLSASSYTALLTRTRTEQTHTQRHSLVTGSVSSCRKRPSASNSGSSWRRS